jgi:hypothetical protein
MLGLIKKFKHSPFAFSVFILSLALFVVNMDRLKENSEIKSINTRHKQGLILPTTKLSKKTKEELTYYSGIQMFNHLPQSIKMPVGQC